MSESLTLRAYAAEAAKTDMKLQATSQHCQFYALGLLGEVGSLLSALKKQQLDKKPIHGHESSTLEELGDVLWYFVRLSETSGLSVDDILGGSLSIEEHQENACLVKNYSFDSLLFDLDRAGAEYVARLRAHDWSANGCQEIADEFLRLLALAAYSVKLKLSDAAEFNINKIQSRWPDKFDYGQLYDDECAEVEQLPRLMEVRFLNRRLGESVFCYQLYNDLPLGDRLTDNRATEDGYRYHDCFHLAYAAILGWSPVLRALLKVKRKSIKAKDEAEDGARAILAEEGIANWLFAKGEQHNFFEDSSSLSFDILNTVKEMASNYEVSSRPYWMWEKAILRGFEVFRLLKSHEGGTVIVNLNERTITFEPPGK